MPESKKKAIAPENEQNSSGWDSAAQEKDNEGWGEIESDFFKFSKFGDRIEGKLIEKSSQVMRNGTVGRYTVESENGEKTTVFLGGTDIDSRMPRIPVGSLIRITYVEDTKTGQGQRMKRFSIQTK